MTEKKDHTDIILDSIADGVFTVDRQWCVTSFNKAAEEITGIPREEAIGQRCCDVFRASICESNCALRETLDTGRQVVNRAVYIVNASGERVPITVSAALLKDSEDNVIGGVETFRDLRTIEELRRKLEKQYTFQDIVSKNSEMINLFDILPTIAESESTVLIEGESGTGKELIARAIHNLSSRKEHPIVTINCGALPDTLLEAELFGYKEGAFTDARKDKPGRFALAEKGTLFLDEIADISPAMQVRLLRVIQERCYEPLGSTESVTANVRILVASNQNLDNLVKSGKFRQDLFYRINVVRLALPPLRERRQDIPLLINHFINRYNSLTGKLITDVSPDVLAILVNHDYPGNVRELENIIEHSFVLCRESVIGVEDLPDRLRPAVMDTSEHQKSFDSLEASFITQVLRRNDWNKDRSAAELGIHKTTLWRKMKKFKIETPKAK
jgi:PAS domain S-box-containing protein